MKNLIQRMLSAKPEDRPSMMEVIHHPVFEGLLDPTSNMMKMTPPFRDLIATSWPTVSSTSSSSRTATVRASTKSDKTIVVPLKEERARDMHMRLSKQFQSGFGIKNIQCQLLNVLLSFSQQRRKLFLFFLFSQLHMC